MTTDEPNQSSIFPRAAVSVAVFRDGKVLLGQRSKPPLTGVWSLPGGRVEPGETTVSAAERELREETHVSAAIEGVVDVVDVILREDDRTLRAHYVLTVFYGRWKEGRASPGDDCLATCWAGPSDLKSLKMTEGTADVIEKARQLLKP